MSIIVIGSEGILGKKIVDNLSQSNKVYCADVIDKMAPNYINLKKNNLDSILAECNEIYLFHGLSRISACNVDPELAIEQNLLSHIKIFDKVRKFNPKIKIILASSIYAENGFGGMYGISKSTLEKISMHYANSWGLDIVIVRIGSVYGDLFDDNSLPIKLLKGHVPQITINPLMRREYTYIDDVINTIISLSEKTFGVFRLRGRSSYGIDDVIKITGYCGSLNFISNTANDAYIEIANQSDAEDIFVNESIPFKSRISGIKNQTFFFDLDGTIFDSAIIKLNSFINFFKLHNALSENTLKYLKDNEGIPRKLKIEKLSQITSLNKDKLSNQFDIFLKHELLNVKPIDGVFDYLTKLKSLKISVILVSAAPLTEVKTLLEKHSMINLIDELNCSVSNKTTLVKDIINKKSINTKYCCYFGDGVTDMNAAKKNNIKYINVGDSRENCTHIYGYNEL